HAHNSRRNSQRADLASGRRLPQKAGLNCNKSPARLLAPVSGTARAGTAAANRKRRPVSPPPRKKKGRKPPSIREKTKTDNCKTAVKEDRARRTSAVCQTSRQKSRR